MCVQGCVCIYVSVCVCVLMSVPVYVCVLMCAYVTGSSVTQGFLTLPSPSTDQVQVLQL